MPRGPKPKPPEELAARVNVTLPKSALAALDAETVDAADDSRSATVARLAIEAQARRRKRKP